MRSMTVLVAAVCLALVAGTASAGNFDPRLELQLSPRMPDRVQNPGGTLNVQVWLHNASAGNHSVVTTITAPSGAEIYRQPQSQADYVSLNWQAPRGLADGFYTFTVEYTDLAGKTAQASERFLLVGETAAICALKFIDIDRDGAYSEGVDQLAAGWEICAISPDLGCQVTPPDEWVVCWFFIDPGTYTICETQQPHYYPTLPACQTFEVHTGEFAKVEFGNAIEQGACCLPTGACLFLTEAECAEAGGIYHGDASDCDPNPCPPPTGACCFHPGGDCRIMTQDECDAAGGTYIGDGVACNPGLCPPTAVERTTWGELKNSVNR